MAQADRPADDELDALRGDPDRARALELRAFLFAVRPIATDLGSTLVFYAVLIASGSVRAATLLGMVLGVAQLGIMAWRRTPIAPLQWASLGLVIVMGGLTLLTHDPRFILVKVSIIYAVVGVTMLQPGWIYRYVPPIAVAHVPRRLVVGFGFVWAALILGTSALNLALTLTTPPRTVAGVMAIWAPGSKLAMFVVQYLVFRAVTRRAIIAILRARAADPAG